MKLIALAMTDGCGSGNELQKISASGHRLRSENNMLSLFKRKEGALCVSTPSFPLLSLPYRGPEDGHLKRFNSRVDCLFGQEPTIADNVGANADIRRYIFPLTSSKTLARAWARLVKSGS